LPDGLFSNQNPNLGKFWRALDCKFYGHLEYITDVRAILLLFGAFCVHLVHFSGFSLPIKIWQPWMKVMLKLAKALL
jgi:hypothetical protein